MRPMIMKGRRAGTLLLFSFILLLSPRSAPAQVQPDPPTRHRVLVLSIDGLRPDALLRADAPVLRSLMKEGSFTMWAMTTAVAVTLPSHVSMLTGVPPAQHRIEWNTDRPFDKQIYPARPTLFELATKAGYTTAMVAGKSKLVTLAKPGTLSWIYLPKTTSIPDTVVTDEALKMIRDHSPEVLFVHLPGVDLAGHDSGWGSETQLAAIASCDRCVGRILNALQKSGTRDSTYVIVSSDHGGAGKSHGPDDPRSRHIPWILSGPGVRRNYDLTGVADLTVRTEDTFATMCYVLGLTPEGSIEGKVVKEAFEKPVMTSHP